MADRYWVGGSGSWNSTTKWSTTSGGASGASVPTSVDNAIFDANSGAAHFTVTVTDNATCANLTITPEPVVGATQFSINNGFVITGTFSTSGTFGNRRVWFKSATYGLMRDVSIATIGTVTDVDFQDIRITGAGGTLSGTRIGDRGGNVNITFSAPKTVYWTTAGSGNWSGDNWAATSGGGASTDNFPLAQDVAVIGDTGLSAFNTITLDTAMTSLAMSGVNMSGRTLTATIAVSNNSTIYGSWTNSSAVTISGTAILTFEGRTTQVITSAGRTFTPVIGIHSISGLVELGDAFTVSSTTGLTISSGGFNTKNYNVTSSQFNISTSYGKTVTLGSSTLTLSSTFSPLNVVSTNLTFDAGTSQITCSGAGALNFVGGGVTYYNVSITTTSAFSHTFTDVNTFNNLTVGAPSSAGLTRVVFANDQIINGTLTVAGATAVRRIFLRSNTLGTTRTLTVGTLSATDCDFRDITIAGAAAGSSPTRAGDCGGNSGITFPAAKTVYWNLSSASTWFGIGWCPTSGGTPDVNSFPLAQDTAVFNDAGAATSVNPNVTCNIGTIDMSARTIAISTQFGTCDIYGNVILSSALTVTAAATGPTFSGRGTQTITSNGVTFNNPITIDCITGTVQLADALSLGTTRTLTLTSGTFDAVSYNVTSGLFYSAIGGFRTLKMGSGTWTLTGTGSVWDLTSTLNLEFVTGTANIVLSNTSTTARTFAGGSLTYNKLTIGGTTGTSTLTITGNNTFSELASTKTVAHTIALGTTSQTFGKWTVTGTVGNVVTLTGTGSHAIAGSATSGIDYLAMGSIGFLSTSPGEFYAGANSTGTAGAPVYRTAPPAARTLYWVGGTGNWSDTARWSTSSGGTGGAALPTSLDDVVFDSLSNATAYTSTINATSRCNKLTVAGPASGNLTLAGSSTLIVHDDFSLPATGLTRTFTGPITFSGSSSGKTINTNGVTLASAVSIWGYDSVWTLNSALDIGASFFYVNAGTFECSTYNFTCASVSTVFANGKKTLDLGSSTVTTSTQVDFGNTITTRENLVFTAGTSQINLTNSTSCTLSGNNKTFYNVAFTSTSTPSISISGQNSFNNLSFTGPTSSGLKNISVSANQTITGTLTLSAGTNATMRHFMRSSDIGVARTLTCAAFSGTDADFRDIAIAGAAAPVSGTRLGDCKGNSGITFGAGVTRYWNLAGSNNWSATGWAATSGGTPADNNFPLAQDTAVFEATSPGTGTTTTINAAYNIGTINMSARTSNTMTLATGTLNPTIYGNWINGTGTTLTGTGVIFFIGRGSQTITSAGKTFTQQISIVAESGSVTLQDALTISNSSGGLTLNSGTFDAATYNVTLLSSANLQASGTAVKTLAIGSGTWTVAASGVSAWNTASTNTTITGTGTISLTDFSGKTFNGNGLNYGGITLNQGGAGALTITGNNTFKDITNTYKSTGATNITFGTTTQRVSQFTAAGESGRLLTLQGGSSTSPCNLVFTGSGNVSSSFLVLTGVRAYPATNTWYAGTSSTNNGTLGWYFTTAPLVASVAETASGADVISSSFSFSASVNEAATGADTVSAFEVLNPTIAESAIAADVVLTAAPIDVSIIESSSITDAVIGSNSVSVVVSESAASAETVAAAVTISVATSETSTASDSISTNFSVNGVVSESATGADAIATSVVFRGVIAEVGTGADAVSSVITIQRAVSETASGSDSVAVAASTFNAAVSETGSGADVVSVALRISRTIAETATGADTISVAPSTFRASVAETGLGSDVVSSATFISRAIVEAASGADSVAVAASTFNASITEAGSGVDAVVASLIATRSVAETATGADTIVGSNRVTVQVAEIASSADALSATTLISRSIIESASGTDAVAVAPSTFNPAVSESGTATDSILAGAVMTTSVVETSTGADALVAAGSLNTTINESASGVDLILTTGAFGVVVQDAAQVADIPSTTLSLSALLSETANGIDTISVSAVFIARAGLFAQYMKDVATGTSASGAVMFDSAAFVQQTSIVANGTGSGTGGFSSGGNYLAFYGGASTLSYFAVTPISLANSATLKITYISGNGSNGGATPTSPFGSTLDLVFRDPAGVTLGTVSLPQSSTYTTATIPITPTLQQTELILFRGFTGGSAVPYWGVTEILIYGEGDLMVTADTAAASAELGVLLLEASTAVDQTLVAPSIFTVTIPEQAQVTDSLDAPGSIYNVTLPEAALVTDAVLGAYLWNLIDDNQNPNWVVISTPQNPGWSIIDDSQDPNWQNISNI